MYTTCILLKNASIRWCLELLSCEEKTQNPCDNNSTAGLRLTQDLSNIKTTQTLGCYIWPRSWVTQKLPKHWKSDPKAQPSIWVKK